MWSLKKATIIWGAMMILFYSNVVFAAPNISTFTATKTLVPVNSSTILTWSVTNATSCTASGEWSGNKSLIGSETTGILSAGIKTFILTCIDASNEVSVASVNVIVANPPTLDFSASSKLIEYNTSTTLIWNSVNASSCEKYGDWSGATTLSGSVSTGNLISEKIFGIRCTGDGGIVEKELTISISNPELQVALNFYADKYFINNDESTVLHWIATNADFCTTDDDTDIAISGSYDTGNLQASETYSIYCANTSGSSELKKITIVVASTGDPTVYIDAWANAANIVFNTPATINWTSEGADTCKIYDSSWVENLPTSGSYVSGNLVASKDFKVRCSNASNITDEVVTVNVTANPDPSPLLSFSADKTGIEYNTSTNLNWNATETEELYAWGDWNGYKDIPSGSESTGNLTSDKVYNLDATGPGGMVRTKVKVSVGEKTIPPTVAISADSNMVTLDYPTVIRWSSDNADWCDLSVSGYDESWEVGEEGDFFTGELDQDYTFKIECGNAAGIASATTTVEISPIGAPPRITLTADKNPVNSGTGTTIRWSVTNAVHCIFENTDDVPFVGSYNTGNLYAERTYTIICSGEGGQTVEDITIDVEGGMGPLPIIELYADVYNISTPRSVKLNWWVDNADRCWASSGPWSGEKTFPGEEDTIVLSKTTLFEISCENVNGIVSASATITFGTIEPIELEFYADNTKIEKNSYVNLTWNGKNAEYCKSYSYDETYNVITNWEKNQSQVAGREAKATVGPISEYETHLLLKCWNFTSETDWAHIVITAGNPPPSVTMSASGIIAYNTPAVISWHADNAVSCFQYNWQGESTWNGEVGTSGLQLTSNLTETTYFDLSCVNADGEEAGTYRRIEVGPSNGVLPKISFTSDKYIAAEGENFTLSWDVKDANWCDAISNPYDNKWDGEIWSPSDSQILTFGGERKEFVLTCGNEDGSVSSIVRINDSDSEFGIPSISLWADDISLPVNGQTTLHWFTENAISCVASNGWSGIKAPGAGQEQTLPLAVGTRFELSCSNGAGTRTAVADVSVGGPPPNVAIDFIASRYDVSAGKSLTLSWLATNASYCYALDPNGVFVGGKTTAGSDVVSPPVSTTYKIVCGNIGGEKTAIVPIVVAKVIVCPNPAMIINIGGTLQLNAWFKQDANIEFSCSNVSGAINITNGYNGFPTDWSSANGALVTVSSGGLATGLDFTDSNGGPVVISAEYKETKGGTKVTVSPPPVSCWKCTETKICSSEITFPADGKCSAGTFNSMYECSKSCRKPVDWQEVGS